MRDPKALALFQEILRKTEAGKLLWQPTAEDKIIATMLGKYTLTLTPYTSLSPLDEPQGPPSVRLQDEKENTIIEIHNDIEGIAEEELKTLLVFARRIALQADEKIDEVLQELQRPDITIDTARYGANDKWFDVAQRLRARIRDNRLTFKVTNEELGGDPIPGVAKKLEVVYLQGDQRYAKSVPEGGVLSIR